MENVSGVMTDKDFIYVADDENYKSINGAVQNSQTVTFSVKLSRKVYAYNIYIIICGCGVNVRLKMEWKNFVKGYDIYSADFYAEKAGLLHYHFQIDVFGKLYFAGRGKNLRSEINSKEEFSLLIYQNFNTPDWFKGGVMYHIFIDRFYRGKDTPVKPYAVMHKKIDDFPVCGGDDKGVYNYDFFGGNINGIIQKLPYIKSLGVNCIVLSPVFEAFSNHKYDTGDYEKIDSMFGTENDFKELIDIAGQEGIKIIIDGVFNHTGSDSKYFNKYGNYKETGAYNSKQSSYYHWYTFTNYPEKYECWWGIATLPQIKKDSESFQKYITEKGGVLSKWLSLGAGGVRLDVVDELSNAFVKKINTCCKSINSETLIIGEVWEDAAEKWAYGEFKTYFWGNGLDSVMNYPFKKAVIKYLRDGDSEFIAETLASIWDKYPRQVCHCLMNVLGTHDTVRILTTLSNIKLPKNRKECKNLKLTESQLEKAIEKLKVASLLQYTVYGVPCIYYGDERGMEGADDPFNRMAVDWEKCNSDLLQWYKTLGDIRKLEVFKSGSYKEIYRKNGVFIFKRFISNEECIIAVNMSASFFPVNSSGYIDLLNQTKSDIINIKSGSFALLINNHL